MACKLTCPAAAPLQRIQSNDWLAQLKVKAYDLIATHGMDTLPKEVLENIFGTLSARDVLHAACKCTCPHDNSLPSVYAETKFAGACASWRRALWHDENWWHAYHDRRWPQNIPSSALPVPRNARNRSAAPTGWQHTSLTHGLHMSWRYKPIDTKQLHHHIERQVHVMLQP